MNNEYSFYIHIPFCKSKCDYCDFYSIPVKPDDALMDTYIEALLWDIRAQMRHVMPESLCAVYIGGGTPSVMGAKRADAFFSRLRGLLPSVPGEWTVELNPESLDEAFLHACKNNGVSRISAGAQTFDAKARRAVRRAGSPARLKKNLECIAKHYTEQFSADLISGLPGVETHRLEQDIQYLAALGCPHISLYDLTLEEKTALWKNVSEHRIMLPPEDAAAEQWIAGRDILAALGYTQYEASNFARGGNICRHNMRYWRMQSWLAAGPSASGTVIDEAAGSALRYTCPASLEAYLRGGASGAAFPDRRYRQEPLPPPVLLKESLLMGFRLAEGPDAALFERRFSIPLEGALAGTLGKWRAAGRARAEKPALTADGLLFLNTFLRDCFKEIEFRKFPDITKG